MVLWDLSPLEENARKKFIENPRRSVSALFRFVRCLKEFEVFGDYLIMSQIIEGAIKSGTALRKSQIQRAFKQSGELSALPRSIRVKMIADFLDRVEQSSTDALIRAKYQPGQAKNQKTASISSQ